MNSRRKGQEFQTQTAIVTQLYLLKSRCSYQGFPSPSRQAFGLVSVVTNYKVYQSSTNPRFRLESKNLPSQLIL